MKVSKQLFNLQEVDQELALNEQTHARITAQLGESKNVLNTRAKLEAENKKLEEITHTQHTVEWEIEDLSAKLSKFETELYSGKTTSPKELSSLQQEIESLKNNRGKLEDRALEIMESIENSNTTISELRSHLEKLEIEWQEQQKDFTTELKELKNSISSLKEKRETLASEIDPQVLTVYEELKKQKGASVAKVEQGICRGCRISLPVNELQQVRSGNMVRCSSCGRILFLA
ncbi:zinc ribbon domain-containing protein [Chloroflexota bacterium]